MSEGKIQILLIDDRPVNWWDDILFDVRSVDLKDHFDIHWLREPEECKQFLELFSTLASSDAHIVGKVGLPPDVMIFDYAMTQTDNDFDRAPGAPSDVLSTLNGLYEERFERVVTRSELPEEITYERGADKFGCFMGGVFARLFADHPCGAVPVTAAAEHATSDDVVFFEWFNEFHFGDLFQHKTIISQDVDQIVRVGLEQFRERFIELAHTKAIEVSVDRLLKIADGHIQNVDSIWITNRYGIRNYAIDSLFFGVEEHRLVDVSSEWAKRVLRGVFPHDEPGSFATGLARALEYMELLDPSADEDDDEDEDTDIVDMRRKLILLSRKKDKTDDDIDELKHLCSVHKVDFEQLIVRPSKTALPAPHRDPMYIGLQDKEKRWAVLITCVLTECRFKRSTLENSSNNDDMQRHVVETCIDPLPKVVPAAGKIQTTLNRVGLRLTDIYKHSASNRIIKHGIQPGEGRALRSLAISLGLDTEEFPTWLKFAPD